LSQYFTKDTDHSIKEFLESKDESKRHSLFDVSIRPAFEKLIENLIYVYKFFTLDDVDTLKQDCLANLYEMLPKFDPNKGTKGFSYFNVVAKNWFIQKTRERTKKSKVERELYVDIDKDSIKNNPSMTFSPYEDSIVEREFWVSLYDEMDMWRSKLSKKNERKVLEAVIFLIQNSELVAIYNKKAVYLYLREMTGLNDKQVAMNLKKMRDMYSKWKERYFEEGH